MAELTRLKQMRSANKNVVNGLITKAKNKMEDDMNDANSLDIEVLLNTIKAKEVLIAKLDADIATQIPEEEVEHDVDIATNFGVDLAKNIARIERHLHPKPSLASTNPSGVPMASRNTTTNKTGVKLPKICIKKFNGDPTAWQQFHETFEATVHKNDTLSAIEKFSYLKGYLSGTAEKCIEGISLSNDNYMQALGLLKERYGNPQLVIASHMDKLLKVDKVNISKNSKELRSLYDQIEGHVRSLYSVGVRSEHYGPLLIPIVLEKLPEEIRLEISRKLGTSNWKIDEFMKVMKDEVTARESCDFMKTQKGSDKIDKVSHFTTETLLSGSKFLVCAFCDQNHYSDKCTIVTEVERRKEMVRDKRLCFKCLLGGHPIRKCRSKTNCFRCKSSSHNTAICEKEANKERRKETGTETSLMVNSKTSVLLQTANGVISDNKEKRSQQIKILLDPGSTKTYISKRVAKQIELKPISSNLVNVKTFGQADGRTENLKEYEFCVKNHKRGCNVYMRGYSVPIICSRLSNQRVENAEKLFPVLQDLDLSDVGDGSQDIDLLIGADYYWTVIEGETKKCNADGLTAINSKLGWILSGPCITNEKKAKEDKVMVSHVMSVQVDLEAAGSQKLERLVENFWNLDTMGIKEDEPSVYQKFIDGIKFVKGRYEVLMPFKEDRPCIEDNYTISEKRLKNLKNKLDKDQELLRKYDKIIQEQIKAGIVEPADTEPEVGEVTYLTHRAVIREDRRTTKIRIVFDASTKNQGRSLNECLFKGPSMTLI